MATSFLKDNTSNIFGLTLDIIPNSDYILKAIPNTQNGMRLFVCPKPKMVEPVDPMILAPAPAEVGIRPFEAEALDMVNSFLDRLNIRTYKTLVSFLSDNKVLSTAHIFYKNEYVELFNCYYDVPDNPHKSLESWFKAVRDGLYSENITAVRVEREGYATYTVPI